jgi:hypothetical protein
VSLASKATEHPRRLREILVPAYRYHPNPLARQQYINRTSILNPDKPRLTFPSDLYDSLRYSTVTSELIVLRVLKFEVRVTLPQVFLARLVSRNLAADSQLSDEELRGTTMYKWTECKIVQAYVPLPSRRAAARDTG